MSGASLDNEAGPCEPGARQFEKDEFWLPRRHSRRNNSGLRGRLQIVQVGLESLLVLRSHPHEFHGDLVAAAARGTEPL